jgi:hypothetical protein
MGTNEVLAQNSHTREGFWIGFGLGQASVKGDCDDVDSGSGTCDAVGGKQGAFAFYLMAGGTLNPNLRIGCEVYNFVGFRDLESSTSTDDQAVLFGTNLALALYYYPMVERGLFLKGGVGAAWYALAESEDSEWDSSGFGLLLGVGYDLRIGGNTSLTPMFTYGWGGGGDLKFGGDPVGQNWSHSYTSFALGLTFH